MYRVGDGTLEITLDGRSLHVMPATSRVLEQGQQPRFLLRAANYLHLNRGKRAWKYIADSAEARKDCSKQRRKASVGSAASTAGMPPLTCSAM